MRKIVEKRVSDLTPYDRNARTHSEKQIEQIVASIRKFGWTNPVLIDENGVVIAGHGRIEAAKKLGMDKVPCLVIDGLTDAERRALTLADNQLALNAGWDEELVKAELADLRGLGFDLEVIGFDDKFISGLFDDEDEHPAQTGQLIESKFSIVVECADEMAQGELLAEFENRGLSCRALML